jgi:TatA/E family protein of Tat protein translocase
LRKLKGTETFFLGDLQGEQLATGNCLRFAAFAAAHYDESMNLGMPEMIFIFLLALVIFGPRKLPELGRQLGKALAEFKKASNEFKSQLETEMLNIELEERAKQAPPDNSPRILPAEKVFDTAAAPPSESIPRASLPAPDPPVTAEEHAPHVASSELAPGSPLAPEVPSQEVPSQNV